MLTHCKNRKQRDTENNFAKYLQRILQTTSKVHKAWHVDHFLPFLGSKCSPWPMAMPAAPGASSLVCQQQVDCHHLRHDPLTLRLTYLISSHLIQNYRPKHTLRPSDKLLLSVPRMALTCRWKLSTLTLLQSRSVCNSLSLPYCRFPELLSIYKRNVKNITV